MIAWVKTKLAKRALARADTLRQTQQWSTAEVLYRKAIKLVATVLTREERFEARQVAGQAHLGLGRTHLFLDQPERAMYELDLACQLLSENWEPLYYKGCAEGRLGDYAKTEKSLSAALSKNATEARVYVQRGLARFKAGLLDPALDDYLEAQRRNELQKSDCLTLAALRLHRAEFSQAEQLLRPLADNRYPEAYLWLGIALERQDKWREAVTVYTQATRIPKIEGEACGRLGMAHARLQQYDQAASCLECAIGKKIETDSVLFYYGWVCYQLRRFETCLNTWDRLRQRHPRKQRLRALIQKTVYAWGCERGRAGDYDTAIRLWTDYYSGRENDEQLARGLAELHLHSTCQDFQREGLDILDEAEEHLAEACELVPNDSRFPFYLAMIEVLNDDFQRGRQLLEDALALYPHDSRLKYYLALLAWEDGDEVQAAETLQALAAQNSGNSWTQRATESLAAVYVEQERWSEAADTLLSMTRP